MGQNLTCTHNLCAVSVFIGMDKKQLQEAILSSVNISEALRKLGLQARTGGNFKTFHKYVQLYDIDISHFTGAPRHKRSHVSDLKDLLVKDSGYNCVRLKKRLIEEGLLQYCCSICGISSWQDAPIVLQLDHINGTNNDNRIENLRLLCPNCHSQTDSYGGKNRKYQRVQNKCIDCSVDIGYSSTRCHSCAGKHCNPTKIDWPTNKELKNKLKNKSYLSLARELGVSDNAIRKRLRVSE